jgi:hypothetical protein
MKEADFCSAEEEEEEEEEEEDCPRICPPHLRNPNTFDILRRV